MKISKSKGKFIGNTTYHIFMIILSIIMIYPFLWAVMSSFKPVEQLYSGNPLNLIPTEFTLQNYKRLMEVLPFNKMLFNSIFLSITIPIAMIIVASLAAYAVTRIEFKGRNVLFFAFIATMMIPSMFTASNAFNIFFFRQYFLSIPKDLENAAIVDGCSKIGVFFKIVLPNAKPAIATTAILSFRNVWNSFLWPMLVINDYDKLPLTVGLKYLKGSEPNWAVLLAGATLSIIPIVIIFLMFQKYFMASTMNSGFGGK